MTMNVEDEWTVDWRYKSFPPSAEGMRSTQLSEAKWHLLTDFTTPVAALKESALAHNLDRMRRYCADHGVRIAPHGKTTMSPELMRRQLEHGAWAMTAATAWQARAMLNFGVPRVIIANECIDPVGLRWLAQRFLAEPAIDVLVFADSLETVDRMRNVMREAALDASRPSAEDPARAGEALWRGAPPLRRRLPVIVEVGVAGGRAGTRDVAAAVAVGKAVAEAPELELAGVGGFEGILGGTRVPEVVEPVRGFLGTMRQTAEELMHADAFRPEHPVILTAGGSAFFDQVVDVFTSDRDRYPQPVEVVIRSGCYVTHDHASYYEASPFRADPEQDFRPAMEVWARVLSTPEPGLAIIDVGKRDLSTDARMPLVLGRSRDGEYQSVDQLTDGAVTSLVVDHFNDQHGFVHVTGADEDASPLRVGDLVALGISHPCTTFDKWRAIPVVDEEYRVLGAVRTFF